VQYQIIITPSTKADIFETNTWFLENYPDLAEKWLWGISQAVMSLSKFPARCAVSAESEAFDVIVRQLFYGKSLIYTAFCFQFKTRKFIPCEFVRPNNKAF